MENYVYSFVEEDAADKFFDYLLKVSSDHFKQPKIAHIDRSTFDRFFKNVIIKPEYHDVTSISEGRSFIKVEYDGKTITVYKLKSSDKRKLVYSIADENDFVFKVENAVAQKLFEDTAEYDKNAVAQKIFEDTVGYDKKNLIDIEKLKEFFEKCEKKFEEYEKTGGYEPFTPSSKKTTIPRELADVYEDNLKKLGADTKNGTIDLLNENLNDPQKRKELNDDLKREVEGYHIDYNIFDPEEKKKKYEEFRATHKSTPFKPIKDIDDQSIKSDAGKLKLTLVPHEIIRAIARARMYGLKKYGDKESWRSVSIDRYNDALCRHILLYLEDPDGVDEESGLSHLDHVACNVAFLCELMKEVKDDNIC